jgi:hypothetical protein
MKTPNPPLASEGLGNNEGNEKHRPYTPPKPQRKPDAIRSQASWSLHQGRSRTPLLHVVPDDGSALWRVAWPDVGPSPAANLTRCKDAARQWAEHKAATEDRKRGGARRLKSLNIFSWSAPYVRQNGSTPTPSTPHAEIATSGDGKSGAAFFGETL